MANKQKTNIQNLDIYNMEPCVVIVSLDNNKPEGMPDIMPPVYYQVTLDPDNFSPSKEFIRFGDVHGDEITGWKSVVDINVHEVLKTFEGAEIPYIQRQKIEVA